MMVCTRFAPSPTGFLHLGGARTALFSWLYARRHRGYFGLRIEDTDSERSSQESTNAILAGLSWLGIDYDEGPISQSERIPRYQSVVNRLLDENKAYHCYCTVEELAAMREQQMKRGEKPRYDRRCRAGNVHRKGVRPTVRFKTPLTGSVKFQDLVHGRIEVENTELDDLVLLRSDGMPTYNLTVVVDDMDMGITHVIRGDDHLSNTPRQIHLIKALNVHLPEYAHLPMILDADGKRLSKRAGAASITEYRKAGYLPEAVLNYLLRLGWAYGDQEIFNTEEMIELFDLAQVNKAAASLNREKLNWLNRHYMKTSDLSTMSSLFAQYLQELGVSFDGRRDDILERVFKTMRDRYHCFRSMAEGSLFFFADIEPYDERTAEKFLTSETIPWFEYIYRELQMLEHWDETSIKAVIDGTLSKFSIKVKQLGPPMRFALSGGMPSPALALTTNLIGRKYSLQRLQRALAFARHQP